MNPHAILTANFHFEAIPLAFLFLYCFLPQSPITPITSNNETLHARQPFHLSLLVWSHDNFTPNRILNCSHSPSLLLPQLLACPWRLCMVKLPKLPKRAKAQRPCWVACAGVLAPSNGFSCPSETVHYGNFSQGNQAHGIQPGHNTCHHQQPSGHC